jgi:hypothetical protein
MAPAAEGSEVQNAVQLLFLSCSLVTMSCPSPRTVARGGKPPRLPLVIKDSQKEDARLFDGDFGLADTDAAVLHGELYT